MIRFLTRISHQTHGGLEQILFEAAKIWTRLKRQLTWPSKVGSRRNTRVKNTMMKSTSYSMKMLLIHFPKRQAMAILTSRRSLSSLKTWLGRERDKNGLASLYDPSQVDQCSGLTSKHQTQACSDQVVEWLLTARNSTSNQVAFIQSQRTIPTILQQRLPLRYLSTNS